MAGKLYRSRSDRMIAGVCGGLAEHFGWDPVLVRLAAVALLFVTNGAAGIAYLVMAALVPEAPAEAVATEPIMPPAADEAAGEGSVEAPLADGQADAPQPQVRQPGPPSTPAAEARPRRGTVWVGVVLVVLGLALLADQVFGMPVWRLWPVFIILYGLGMIVRAVRS